MPNESRDLGEGRGFLFGGTEMGKTTEGQAINTEDVQRTVHAFEGVLRYWVKVGLMAAERAQRIEAELRVWKDELQGGGK